MRLKLVRAPSVYIITSDAIQNLYKIGFSTDINNRIKSYHTSIPGKIRVVHIQYFKDITGMKIAKNLMHYSLASYRPMDNKEWFETKYTSYFITELNKIADIINDMSKTSVGR